MCPQKLSKNFPLTPFLKTFNLQNIHFLKFPPFFRVLCYLFLALKKNMGEGGIWFNILQKIYIKYALNTAIYDIFSPFSMKNLKYPQQILLLLL